VCALAQGETNPSCLAELSGVAVPAVSQHLAKLRLAGICQPHRDGQRVWYELIDDGARTLVRQLFEPAMSTRRSSP
jgi:DNA-binding transcriptional ArsR family regulator